VLMGGLQNVDGSVQGDLLRQYYCLSRRDIRGGWLAWDGGGSVTTAIAGKPAPTLTAFTTEI
jgi:hypothetical protein